MPEYIYRDLHGHTTTVIHPMVWSKPVICQACRAEMWRVPQSVYVNWGGLPPSKGEPPPVVKNLVADADERRERYLSNKEARHEN